MHNQIHSYHTHNSYFIRETTLICTLLNKRHANLKCPVSFTHEVEVVSQSNSDMLTPTILSLIILLHPFKLY